MNTKINYNAWCGRGTEYAKSDMFASGKIIKETPKTIKIFADIVSGGNEIMFKVMVTIRKSEIKSRKDFK